VEPAGWDGGGSVVGVGGDVGFVGKGESPPGWACEIANLVPHLGFLHAPRRGRPSLALDLMEEFRPVLVDATVVRLTRTGQITPADFTTTTELGCRMTDDARRTFLAAYETRMLTLVHHPAEQRRIPWRQALAAQAHQIAGVLTDRVPDYRPVIWRVNDDPRPLPHHLRHRRRPPRRHRAVPVRTRPPSTAVGIRGRTPRQRRSTRDTATQFRQTLRTLLNPDEDQIRLYPLHHTA
jgi:hypothetical protein